MAINPSAPSNPAGGATCPIMPCPRLDIEILEIEWLGGHRTARENVTITAPHWRNGGAISRIMGVLSSPIDFINNEDDAPALFHYATGARRAAVYEISGSATFTNPKVKVKLKTVVGKMFSQSDVGQAMTLEMSLDTLIFKETTFNLPALNTPIELELELSDDSKNTVINTLQAIAGDATWTVTSSSKCAILKQTTRLEVFFIYAQPATFYTNGVWVEALRFLFRNAGIQGDSAVATTASKIARYCHNGHGLVYDTVSGAAKYTSLHTGEVFRLMEYLNKSSANIVNCYDQAGAVQALCGAVGIETTWIFMNPYGFINTLDLVGVGSCNNPFYHNTSMPVSPHPVVTMEMPLAQDPATGYPLCTDGMIRTAFGNHAFVKLNHNNNIIDACAGPALGTELLLGYTSTAINADCNRLVLRSDGPALVRAGAANDTAGITTVEW